MKFGKALKIMKKDKELEMHCEDYLHQDYHSVKYWLCKADTEEERVRAFKTFTQSKEWKRVKPKEKK